MSVFHTTVYLKFIFYTTNIYFPSFFLSSLPPQANRMVLLPLLTQRTFLYKE